MPAKTTSKTAAKTSPAPRRKKSDAKVDNPYPDSVPVIVVTDERAGRKFATPDFGKIVGPLQTSCEDWDGGECGSCKGCSDMCTPVTARNMDMLHTQANNLHALLLDDSYDPSTGGSVDEWRKRIAEYYSEKLPPIVLLKITPEWFDRFAQCFADLRDRALTGERPSAQNTAEEMALHIIYDYCNMYLEVHDQNGESPHLWPEVEAALPEHANDYDFEWMRESTLDDFDVLWLFRMELDGIEDSDLGESLGVANLRFDDWFKPFYGELEAA